MQGWYEAAGTGGETFLLPEEVCASFVRITSLRSAFPAVGSGGEAVRLVEAFGARRGVRIVRPSPDRLSTALRLVREMDLRTNDVPDAFPAAFALELDATLVTFDRGFARFASVKTEILPTG